MAMKHEEEKALKSFSRVGEVKASSKSLRVSKGAIIGIKMWGKIDYLTHYRGWTLVSV